MSEPQTGSSRFLDLPDDLAAYADCRVVVWPLPYERTTSWQKGTRRAPQAILEASAHVELYDDELDWEPSSMGIHTLETNDTSALGETEAINLIYENARAYMGDGKFVLTLGGEHTLSSPIVRAGVEKYSGLSVLQIDAHADLRDTYEGTPYSHASVMRRIVEICPAVQVGIRSISKEEIEEARRLQTQIVFARDIVESSDWTERVVNALTDTVYVTIDVDGLDPSIMPATGTPEPGGLDWHSVMKLIERSQSKPEHRRRRHRRATPKSRVSRRRFFVRQTCLQDRRVRFQQEPEGEVGSGVQPSPYRTGLSSCFELTES